MNYLVNHHKRFYSVWRNMMQRCLNQKHKDYKNYGGRGIKVCENWHKYENFEDDVYEDYFYFLSEKKEKPTLERVNNEDNYCKENCRWATIKEQSNNRRIRNGTGIEYFGEIKTIAEWARNYGMKPVTLKARIGNYGWSFERAITEPVNHSKYRGCNK
jgi:hypothetical protein